MSDAQGSGSLADQLAKGLGGGAPVVNDQRLNKPQDSGQQARRKKPTALDQIRKAREHMRQGNILERIEEAQQVKEDPDSIAAFLEAVAAADAFAQSKADGPEACTNWYGLTLDGLENQLNDWMAVEGREVIGPILDTLKAFKLKVSVTGSLWLLVNELLRPAQDIQAYWNLIPFMMDLSKPHGQHKARARVIPVAKLKDEDKPMAIILRFRKGEFGFLPALRGAELDPEMAAVWPWIKEAEARAKHNLQDRVTQLDELQSQYPLQQHAEVEASTARIRILFRLSEGRGALIQFQNNGQELWIQIQQVVGMAHWIQNTDWIRYDAGLQSWPREAEDLYEVFDEWRKA
jgi:hypothetical protein